MRSIGWVGVVSGALLTGAAIAGILVLPRMREPIAALLAAVGIVITFASIANLSHVSGSPAITLMTGIIVLCAVAGGYALVSALLPGARAVRPTVPELPPAAGGRILVMLLTETEAAVYRPSDVGRQIADLTDVGLPEPSMAALPFFYASQKARYRAAGGTSPESGQARALAELVSSRLDPSRFAGPALLDCHDPTLLSRTVEAAVDQGFSRIVVATPYVSEPFCIDLQKRELDAARHDADRVSVIHADALWGSERIASWTAGTIADLVTDPERTGVALIVHGQPGRLGQEYGDFESEENAFANRVRMMVAERGVPEEKIVLCWDAWNDPGITETVRHLAAFGSDRILVAPVTYPFESLDTLLEIPAAIKQARTAEEVHVVQVAAWRDDPVIADEIVRTVEEAARGF